MIAVVQGAKHRSWLAAGLPKLAAAAMTVLVAYTLAGLTWHAFFPAPKAHTEVAALAPGPDAAADQTPNYAWQIANLHLFGRAPEQQPVRVLDAPETRLNLTLRGVYSTGDDQALAIIGSGSGEEKFYRVGDAISGGGTLKAVYWDRVLLEHNGRMETLRLPRSESGELVTVAAGDDAGLSATTYESAYSDSASELTPAYVPTTQTSPVNLGRLREQILQNPGRLGDMVQATPVNENGRFMGYRLTPQGNAQVFGQLGLQDGDIVTAVNGIAIDRPDKGLLALQDLVKAEQVSVTLLRNGTEITVEHSLAR